MSAITLDNVSKRYGDVHALRPLSVEFPAGKLSTIFGKSGSGKTTLLSVIAGLLKPTTGAIWYQDKDIAALTKDECAALRRTDIRGNNGLGAGAGESRHRPSWAPVPRRNLRWGAAAGGYRPGHRGHPNRAAR